MSRNINIAMIQMHSCIGEVELNINNAIKNIKQSAKEGADIVCLPELFATGYNMDIREEYNRNNTLKYYDYITSKISDIAIKENLHIIVPIALVNDNKIYNSALLFDNNGNILGDYAKTHLFSKESNVFDEGNEFKVFDTSLGKIGIMICYDAGFPEACRSLTLKGAEIVFCPAAWRKQDKEMWNLNLRQRALENTIFVVGVNAVGNDNNLHLFGNSKICNPAGQVIAEADEDIEKNLVFTVDIEEVYKYRNKYPYLRDRKVNSYNLEI